MLLRLLFQCNVWWCNDLLQNTYIVILLSLSNHERTIFVVVVAKCTFMHLNNYISGACTSILKSWLEKCIVDHRVYCSRKVYWSLWIPSHLTPASSKWSQLLDTFRSGALLQTSSWLSLPVHCTSSSAICPPPWPKWALSSASPAGEYNIPILTTV